MAKQLEQVKDCQPKRLKSIKFGIQTSQDVIQQSVIEVSDSALYDIHRHRAPHPSGPLDPRLGTSIKKDRCDTCFLPLQQCPGHFGHVHLPLPVFHIGYFRFIITILQNICKDCSSILLPEDERREFFERLRRPSIDNLYRQRLIKCINERCNKPKACPSCGATNGTVKKAGPMKIVHDRFTAFNRSTAANKVPPDEKNEFDRSFAESVKRNPEVAKHQCKALDDLTPLRVLNLLRRVSPADCVLLGLDPHEGRPEMFIWEYLPVSPVSIRPSIPSKLATTEDDLTTKLAEIVNICNNIRRGLVHGTPIAVIMEQWEFLQFQVAMYIDSEKLGNRAANAKAPVRAFAQRLKGKKGRFRQCLSGKRVDFCGRSVISPDPNLGVDEVGVPLCMAKNLTYPERVNRINRESLQKLVVSGPDRWPGANAVIFQGGDGYKQDLKYGDRNATSRQLRIGDIVERHIRDGDIALFNRQPSLHKLSMMAHFVKIHTARTLRLNECVCGPYGADFDGDEMNIFVPQTEEAKAEALTLMGVGENLVSPKNGEPVIAAIQDFITAAYLISSKDRFLSRQQFAYMCAHMTGSSEQVDLPPPAIVKPRMLWTGKQVFNVLIRPNQRSVVKINLEAKCKAFKKPPASESPDLDPDDNYLVIHNSEVMCGRMDKSTVGAGKKNSLFYVILRDYGQTETIAAMNRLARLSARFMSNYGMSLGVFDVHPMESLQNDKEKLVADADVQCEELVRQFRAGELQKSPGCNLDQTLEHAISGVLSKVRSKAGELCLHSLSKNNAPLTMATSGAKGLAINVAQMVALVGQQIIGGQRVPNSFGSRSLPHFPQGSRKPAARGFVQNSFYSGLLATEFIFHAMSGREGVVDTAVKTASTGYISRRLVKALEDLSTRYDDTVRTLGGEIVQFQYGGDNLDPTDMEGSAVPVNFDHVWLHSQNATLDGAQHSLRPDAAIKLCASLLVEKDRQLSKQTNPVGYVSDRRFLSSIHDYVADRVTKSYQPQHSASGPQQVNTLPGARVSVASMGTFIELCLQKFRKAHVEPGHPVGVTGSQSIGEPGTQMTLKTFHFAGVAGMNITEGIPRIEEIIGASKTKIATSIITCPLANPHDVEAARDVKGRIEKTCLSDVLEYIEEEWSSSGVQIMLKVDEAAFRDLHLEMYLGGIATVLSKQRDLNLGPIVVDHKTRTITIPPAMVATRYKSSKKPADEAQSEAEQTVARMAFLKKELPRVRISGCPDVKRVIIQTEAGKHGVFVEGYGLLRCMNTDGVVGTKVTTNFVTECMEVLGIEAARQTIINELQSVMREMNVDPRHLELLSDIMTYQGEVLGVNRFGMTKMHDSILRMAAFEQTTDQLFDAATKLKIDPIQGVSECVITGQTMGLGTGGVGMVRPLGLTQCQLERRPTVFEDAWMSTLGKRLRQDHEKEEEEGGKRRRLTPVGTPRCALG